MGKMGCFSAVIDTINHTVTKNGINNSLNEQKQKKLWSACAIIDRLDADGVCEFAQAVYDKPRVSIILKGEYEVVLQGGRAHPFFTLIKMFDSFSIKKAGQDSIHIVLNYDVA